MKYFVFALIAIVALASLNQEVEGSQIFKSRPIAGTKQVSTEEESDESDESDDDDDDMISFKNKDDKEVKIGVCDCEGCKCVPQGACQNKDVVPYENCSGNYVYVCCKPQPNNWKLWLR